MKAHGAFLTALLSACAASGQDVGAGGLHELHNILQAHDVLPHSNPAKSYLQEYISGLTQAADDGTTNSEGEEVPVGEEAIVSEEAHTVVDIIPVYAQTVVPPPPPMADDADAEAELRWLQVSNASNNATTVAETTTTAAETTTGETTAAAADGAVEVTFTVMGVDHSRLVANNTALTNFILVTREALADHFGVQLDRVSVTIEPGSIKVNGIVIPPEGTTAAELLEPLEDEDLATVAVQYIRAADVAVRIGFDAVTGEIAVDTSSVGTTVIPLPTTSGEAFTCTCRDGTAASGRSCTADNAQVCDQCNDGFELSTDSVCEVSTKDGALTSGRSGCVYRFIGGGYCHPAGIQEEKRLRIGSWALGDRQDAEKACCKAEACGGFHLDKDVPDFVMLRELATKQDTWERRECWKKITQDGGDLEDSDSVPLQALPLAAAAAAVLLHAAGA